MSPGKTRHFAPSGRKATDHVRKPFTGLLVIGLLLQVCWTPPADAAPRATSSGRRAWLGASLLAKPGGVTVGRVVWRSPAARAGLRRGDVITALDRRPVRTPQEVRAVTRAATAGRVVWITWRRGGRSSQRRVRLEAAPPTPGFVRLHLVHAPARDFTLRRIGAPGTVKLASLRGRVTLVYFFATWCQTCQPALRLLARLHRRHFRNGLSVVALGQDSKPQALRRLVQTEKLPYVVAHNPGNTVGKSYRIRIVPSLVLVDRQGVIRTYVQGAGWTYRRLERVIRRLLARRRPQPQRPLTDDLWARGATRRRPGQRRAPPIG